MNNNNIVLNILKKSTKGLSAYEILNKFQKYKKIQPMTVYRALKKLTNDGLIHKTNKNKRDEIKGEKIVCNQTFKNLNVSF